MKRVIALLLATVLCLLLVACGKDYTADFAGILNISSFDITEDNIIALEDGIGYETRESEDSKILEFDNEHIYRFSTKDGSFEFVKWCFSGEAVANKTLREWTEDFGEPEINEKLHFYTWYGNVDGEKAILTIMKGTQTILEIDKLK